MLEYVKYTNRHALVQEFVPTPEEQRLYDVVSEYLQQPTLYALPASQRSLMTLILRKLLASSTYAISDTLSGLAFKLETPPPRPRRWMPRRNNWPTTGRRSTNWPTNGSRTKKPTASPSDRRHAPSRSPKCGRKWPNSASFTPWPAPSPRIPRAKSLLTALRRGRAAAARHTEHAGRPPAKGPHLHRVPPHPGIPVPPPGADGFAGKVVVFNGTNTDPESKEIYRSWLKQHAGTDRVSGSPAADMRAALVEYFRDEAAIMIATEAAAEGINLQFCTLVVNYDLPWNPQRIEQRIGRCHRYGQKLDVVVVNFLNRSNAADQRVYELLDEKIQALSRGVRGKSTKCWGPWNPASISRNASPPSTRNAAHPTRLTMRFRLFVPSLRNRSQSA